jgi:uncharacterized protein
MDPDLIPVTIDSIRVSLVSPHRIVVLKDEDERFLPIWIGPFEAEAINIALQGTQPGRPLTHDLFKSLIQELGGTASHIVVVDLREDTFYARIVMDLQSQHLELDARPSDAIALAVRMQLPIYVADQVMSRASIRASQTEAMPEPETEDEDLGAFRDLLQDLDLDGLGKSGKPPKED